MALLIKASMFLFKAHIYILIIKLNFFTDGRSTLGNQMPNQDKLTVRVPYIIHPTPQVIKKDYTSLAPSLKSHPILCNKD